MFEGENDMLCSSLLLEKLDGGGLVIFGFVPEIRELAARDHAIMDMGLGGGGREHPNALRGVRECARLDVFWGVLQSMLIRRIY
jgi:hypothetical protein